MELAVYEFSSSEVVLWKGEFGIVVLLAEVLGSKVVLL
jgi:hypothetical protein